MPVSGFLDNRMLFSKDKNLGAKNTVPVFLNTTLIIWILLFFLISLTHQYFFSIECMGKPEDYPVYEYFIPGGDPEKSLALTGVFPEDNSCISSIKSMWQKCVDCCIGSEDEKTPLLSSKHSAAPTREVHSVIVNQPR